ncbi:MAG: DMT family transporter [Candidatus Helarchaeota archaeon]
MVDKNKKFGYVFALLSNIFGGIQPIVANLRPAALDAHIYSGMTAFVQILLFIPIFMIETRLFKITKNKNIIKEQKHDYKLHFGKSKWNLFILIGIMFSLVMFLYYSGLTIAGSINGTLALKSTAFFGLIFGFILLKEKVTLIQIIFSCILFLGLIIAVTQGNFNLLEINFGVILILICSAIWMFGHTCSKPYLQNRLITSSELIIWRNLFTSMILIISYLLMFGPNNFLDTIFDPNNTLFYILGGILYGANVFSWYQIIKYLDVSLGTILITPQVIITAFFGSILLNEVFSIYHLIGLIIILGSIIIINWESKRKYNKK